MTNQDFFHSAHFYGSFRNAFLRKYNFSAIAEDAASFAIEKFLTKIKILIFATEGHAYAYLWQVAENKYYRDKKRLLRSASLDKVVHLTEDGHSFFERNDVLEKALTHFKKKNKDAIEFLRKGFSVREIAEELQEKPDTVRRRIARIGLKLRAMKNF